MITKNLNELIPPPAYGHHVIYVKAKAEGYTDSDKSEGVDFYCKPKLEKKDDDTLTISNCRAAATSYEIYVNDTHVYTVAYDGEDNGTIDVDLSALTFVDGASNAIYVKGTGTGVEENQSNSISVWGGETMILGVSGLYQSEPTLTRTDAAEGLSWTISNNVVSSDFDDLFPYSLMQKETIDGDDFVYVPEMYWRIGYDSNNYITDIAVSQGEMPAGENQVIAHSDAFYFGVYGASVSDSKMYSKSGVSRTYNTTCGNYRTYAKARGEKYRQLDLYHMRILDFLWLIEFATKNSDSVMMGYTGYGQSCGGTDSLTAPTAQTGTNGRMRYRYIEDFIGNGLEFFDGAYGLYATDDESKYGTQAGEVTYSSMSGYCLSALKINTEKPLLAVPGAYVSNSSYNTYFCDCVYSSSGDYVCYRGRYGSSADNGLFYWNGRSASSTSTSFGSRLLKLL